jgi:outer membrane protein
MIHSFPLYRQLLALLAAGLFLTLTTHAQAQPRIATVDLKKVFEGYFRTKQADAQLRERGAEAEKQYKGMLDDYQKASEEYKRLIESANDQAVSADERERRKRAAETKVLELNEFEKTLAQYQRQVRDRFEEQKLRMREEILRVIREEVNRRARQGNYTLVLDSSAESRNEASFILFNAGQNDLTDEILTHLNLPAPPGILNTTEAPKLNIPDPEREREKPARGRK